MPAAVVFIEDFILDSYDFKQPIPTVGMSQVSLPFNVLGISTLHSFCSFTRDGMPPSDWRQLSVIWEFPRYNAAPPSDIEYGNGNPVGDSWDSARPLQVRPVKL